MPDRSIPPFSSGHRKSPRALALDLLIIWENGEEFAAALIDRQATTHRLEHRDAALLQSLVFSVLRNVSLLDHWLEQLCEGRHLETRIHWLLRLGLTQLLLLDHAPHAAVNETVNLTDGQDSKARGFVNAILRRTLREKEALLAQVPRLPLHERYSHPDWLVARWEGDFSHSDAEQLCEWNQQPALTYLRVNRLHPDVVDPAAEGFKPTSVADFYQADQPPLEWLQQGQVYIQDPSTAHACQLLAPQPGELVLDACAAPGGKTAYLAQMMENRGRILACDSSSKRLHRMRSNLQRLNVTIAEPILQDWTEPLSPTLSGLQFDRILVDAPCSNTGVMRRRLDVRWRLEPETFPEMQELQLQLTESLLPLLKSGGHLVYSTCSIDPDENDQVITQLFAKHPELQLRETKRILPWKDQTDGAFAALLVKS